jgi:hypothetical protein
LRDSRHGSRREACTIFARTLHREGMNCRRGPKGMSLFTGDAVPRALRSATLPIQPLPDMSHFAAEFYEYCANLLARI